MAVQRYEAKVTGKIGIRGDYRTRTYTVTAESETRARELVLTIAQKAGMRSPHVEEVKPVSKSS